MTAEIDVYQVCPCGSGKKLKFCCLAIAGDISKIIRLQENHQYAQALQALDVLDKKPALGLWSKAWLKTARARILIAEQKLSEARECLADALRHVPEYPTALGLNGYVAFALDGYPASRPEIYSAFQHATAQQATLVAHLASALANFMLELGHPMAARQHFLLALKWSPDDERYDEELAEFESNRSIPYPLRGDYSLKPLADPAPFRSRTDAAERLAADGCFNDAAKQYRSVAQQEPNDPALWYDIGLCDAWSGDDALAAEAFRVSARLQTDFESAVECEALARLLSIRTSKKRVNVFSGAFRVKSPSKLLTLLDQHKFLAREDSRMFDPDGDMPKAVASYAILDRDPVPDNVDGLTPDDIPNGLGVLQIYDSQETGQDSALAHMTWVDTVDGTRVQEKVLEAAGPEMELLRKVDARTAFDGDLFPLHFTWHFPATLSGPERRRLQRQRWQRNIHDIWPNLKLEVLGDRTPLEAAGIEDLKTALAAAVLVLDTFCDRMDYALETDLLRARLNLPPMTPLEVAEDDDLSRLSILELRRVPLHLLTQGQFMEAAARILALEHSALTYQALTEAVARPGIVESSRPGTFYLRLSQLCHHRNKREEALAWISKGRQMVMQAEHGLKDLCLWDLEEMAIRAEDPADPLLPETAHRLWHTYTLKLPEFRPIIVGLLQLSKLPGPWNQPAVVGAAEPARGAEGIWTPDAEPVGGPSKLWLPGQS